MAARDSKAADFERRRSARASVRVSHHGADDETLEFGAAAVPDGFMPRPSSPQRVPPTSPYRPAALPDTTPSPPKATSQKRSSIAKPPRNHDSFTLRNEGSSSFTQPAPPTRSPSVSSNGSSNQPDHPTQSTYDGPSGPSHPYQMYPQIVRAARTLSVVTSSTTTPSSESQFAGPSGAAFPHDMYSQAATGQPSTNPAPVPAIPVGFLGVPDVYQRRLGPEGEEVADLIGPNGHTEQLPPYTRYPDEQFARKVRDAERGVIIAPATSAAGPSSLSVPPPQDNAGSVPQSIPGAGGIGLATRDPEYDPSLTSPQSRQSTRSFASERSQHEVNTAAAAVVSEKKPLKKWQVYARRRLWGVIPYWSICLTISTILVVGIILGAVIGTFFLQHRKAPPPHHGDPNDPDSMQTVTVTYDVTPISTPASMAILPTGTFGVPLATSRASTNCFNDTRQLAAWSCNLAVFDGLSIAVQRVSQAGAPDQYNVSLLCNSSSAMSNNVYVYGEQPPTMQAPATLQLVNDTFEPDRGPAWFHMVSMTKTIILAESALSAAPTASSTSSPGRLLRRESPSGSTSGPTSRTGGPNGMGGGGGGGGGGGSSGSGGNYPYFGGGSGVGRKSVAQIGDRPWICTWPGTFYEVFIFPNQNSSVNNSQGYMGPDSRSSSTSSATTLTTTPKTRLARDAAGATQAAAATTTSSTRTAQTGPSGTWTNQGGNPSFTGMPNFLPGYPRVVKIEERRVPDSGTPVCKQVEIQGVGRPATPVLDSSGNPVVIAISENESNNVSPGTGNQRRDGSQAEVFPRGVTDMSNCGCQWWIM